MGHQYEEVPVELVNLEMPDKDNLIVGWRKGKTFRYFQVETDEIDIHLVHENNRVRLIILGGIRVISDESDDDDDDDSLPGIDDPDSNIDNDNDNEENVNEGTRQYQTSPAWKGTLILVLSSDSCK